MRLEGTPISAMLPDPRVGDDTMVAAALILMDQPQEIMWSSGYYWTRTGADAPVDSMETWENAVVESRGPFRSVDLAFQGAETACVEGLGTAMLLDAAAENVRSGELEPNVDAIAEYMAKNMPTPAATTDGDTGEAESTS